jgi:hypothetical protein
MRTAVILLESHSKDQMWNAWENTYIEGYLPLALNIVKQVVHDGKKNHVLVSTIVLDEFLWEKGCGTDILRASCSSSWSQASR